MSESTTAPYLPTEITALYNEIASPRRWVIQYYDGANWLTIPARRLGSVDEELNGSEKATFAIPNTAENRAFVLNDYPARFLFDYVEVYSGAIKAVGYSLTELAVTVYNDVYELMQRRVYSRQF